MNPTRPQESGANAPAPALGPDIDLKTGQRIYMKDEMKNVEDYDRRRATDLLLGTATKTILTADEVAAIHRAIFASNTSDDRKWVAMDEAHKLRYGKVLTYEEAVAIAQGIDEIWMDKPVREVGEGVKDTSYMCHGCKCGSKQCPECRSCQFSVDATGGAVRNSLTPMPVFAREMDQEADCGCGN